MFLNLWLFLRADRGRSVANSERLSSSCASDVKEPCACRLLAQKRGFAKRARDLYGIPAGSQNFFGKKRGYLQDGENFTEFSALGCRDAVIKNFTVGEVCRRNEKSPIKGRGNFGV